MNEELKKLKDLCEYDWKQGLAKAGLHGAATLGQGLANVALRSNPLTAPFAGAISNNLVKDARKGINRLFQEDPEVEKLKNYTSNYNSGVSRQSTLTPQEQNTIKHIWYDAFKKLNYKIAEDGKDTHNNIYIFIMDSTGDPILKPDGSIQIFTIEQSVFAGTNHANADHVALQYKQTWQLP